MSYLNSKKGSVEESIKEMQKNLKDSAYQDMFKKELEKAGKGIASMSPAEKKAFFNKIDDKYKAKNEELSAAQKKLPPALQKAIKDKEDKNEAVDNPYAVGMAAAMKSTGDKPPLKKSTITKAHDIAKSIEKDEKKEEVKEETLEEYTSQQIKMAYGVANDKRYKGGNMTGAVAAIEKIAKGLSNHPDVQKVLKRTNEEDEKEIAKLKEDVAKLIETHTFMTNKMNKKQKDADGEKEIVKPIEDTTGTVKETKKMSEQTAKNFDLYRAIHSVWSNAADKLDEIKKEAKYLKPEEVEEEKKDQSTLAKPNDAESVKEKKGKTMVDSKKTMVDMEPEVDYQK